MSVLFGTSFLYAARLGLTAEDTIPDMYASVSIQTRPYQALPVHLQYKDNMMILVGLLIY